METTEAQTFRQEYRELDAASMALFRTIIDLTLILLKQQSTSETQKGAAP